MVSLVWETQLETFRALFRAHEALTLVDLSLTGMRLMAMLACQLSLPSAKQRCIHTLAMLTSLVSVLPLSEGLLWCTHAALALSTRAWVHQVQECTSQRYRCLVALFLPIPRVLLSSMPCVLSCNCCLALSPSQGEPSKIQSKSVAAMRVLLRVAEEYGSYLETDSWDEVLTAVSQLEMLLQVTSTHNGVPPHNTAMLLSLASVLRRCRVRKRGCPAFQWPVSPGA